MFYIFQLFLSSAALFTYKHIHIYRAVESQAFAISASFEANINAFRMFLISFIHICLTTNSLTFPPSPCPLVSVNVINHSSLSAHVLHIPTLFILCSSFYLFICTQIFPFTNILHPYFVNNQLTFPPSQCPLVSANVINHSSLSAYVLHIPTLSILCSSFTFPYLPKPSPSQISFIHIFVEQPTTFPPSACPLVSVNEINHSSLSAHVLHISFPLYYIFRSEREKERQRAGKARVALL